MQKIIEIVVPFIQDIYKNYGVTFFILILIILYFGQKIAILEAKIDFCTEQRLQYRDQNKNELFALIEKQNALIAKSNELIEKNTNAFIKFTKD